MPSYVAWWQPASSHRPLNLVGNIGVISWYLIFVAMSQRKYVCVLSQILQYTGHWCWLGWLLDIAPDRPDRKESVFSCNKCHSSGVRQLVQCRSADMYWFYWFFVLYVDRISHCTCSPGPSPEQKTVPPNNTTQSTLRVRTGWDDAWLDCRTVQWSDEIIIININQY